MTGCTSKIVIIDDDENHLFYLTTLLRQAGYQCVAFPQARKAIQYIAENSVALVITEVLMPDLDGIEVLRTLKATFPDVPVVALCGNHESDLYLRLMDQLGANASFTKPIKPPAILRVIESWVRKQFEDTGQLELPMSDEP
jgi:DNA-binding response OmpR family regulator